MHRVMHAGILAAGVLTGAPEMWRARAQSAAPVDASCQQPDGNRTAYHCEIREEVMPAPAALDVDPGRNGSIHVRGWERAGEMRLRTRVAAWAPEEPRATEIVKAVRVTSVGGRIRSDGPTTLNTEHWSTSFHLDVPRTIGLAMNAVNGGISVEEVRGAFNLRTENGGITLRHVAGDVRGRTRNGGLRVELAGTRWEGTGLDLETHNGSIRFVLPAAYSAELEAGTVNGRVEIDFPVLIHAGRERRFTTTLGSGGPKIRAVTQNGSLSIRQQ